MSRPGERSDLPSTEDRRATARALVGSVEVLICGAALFWLLRSEQGRHAWVWIIAGLPLFFAYVFIGGYVRHRLSILERR
jgi:hypothetical protein